MLRDCWRDSDGEERAIEKNELKKERRGEERAKFALWAIGVFYRSLKLTNRVGSANILKKPKINQTKPGINKACALRLTLPCARKRKACAQLNILHLSCHGTLGLRLAPRHAFHNYVNKCTTDQQNIPNSGSPLYSTTTSPNPQPPINNSPHILFLSFSLDLSSFSLPNYPRSVATPSTPDSDANYITTKSRPRADTNWIYALIKSWRWVHHNQDVTKK